MLCNTHFEDKTLMYVPPQLVHCRKLSGWPGCIHSLCEGWGMPPGKGKKVTQLISLSDLQESV